MLKKLLASVICIGSIVSQNSFAQEKNKGEVHGNVDMTLQQYSADTLINAVVPAAKAGYNAFGNIIYTNGDFSAGMRFESYLNALNGYPDRFSGTRSEGDGTTDTACPIKALLSSLSSATNFTSSTTATQ